MTFNIKRVAVYALAMAVGAAAFSFVCLSPALAAGAPCPSNTICKNNVQYTITDPVLQQKYLNAGGTCGPCGQVSPN